MKIHAIILIRAGVPANLAMQIGGTFVLTELTSSNRVVGVKQSRKAIRDGRAAKVFLACDADPAITDSIRSDCAEKDIPLEGESSMEQLGRACSITVGAAVAVLLK